MLQEARYVVRVNALPKLCHFFLDGSADSVRLHGEEMLGIRTATAFSRYKRHSTGFLMGWQAWAALSAALNSLIKKSPKPLTVLTI